MCFRGLIRAGMEGKVREREFPARNTGKNGKSKTKMGSKSSENMVINGKFNV